MHIPIIETERLLLRPFCQSDLDPFAEMNADPQVVAYLANGLPVDRNESWRILAWLLGHWHLRGYGSWAVEEKATKSFVGRIGLFHPEGWPGIEISYVLRRPFWGKGYATEGGKVAMTYAFEELRLPRLISLIHPDNWASIRVAERLGETLEGQRAFKGRAVLVYARNNPSKVMDCSTLDSAMSIEKFSGLEG